MAAFLETPRFPEEVSAWARGGPEFKTMIAAVSSGAEQRNSLWTFPLGKWDIGAGLREIKNAEATVAFHRNQFGRAYGFRMKDPLDSACLITAGVVVGLTGTTFQLYKNYTIGAVTVSRKIAKPLASGLVLKNSGTTLTLTTDYALDTTTGIVTTATSKTAANLTWSGSFDVPVRFDDDWLQLGLDPGGLINYDSIILKELRL
jgi:uncharacterized protein (TIGR02217 family)